MDKPYSIDLRERIAGYIAAGHSRRAAARLGALVQGLDPLFHSAEGQDDPAVESFRKAVASSALEMPEANQGVGEALRRILLQTLNRSSTRRAILSGGDMSGHATRQLSIFCAVSFGPDHPRGAALFKANADGPMDG
jgi:uncharacterized protein YgbK (DUF1537 family)